LLLTIMLVAYALRARAIAEARSKLLEPEALGIEPQKKNGTLPLKTILEASRFPNIFALRRCKPALLNLPTRFHLRPGYAASVPGKWPRLDPVTAL